MKQILFAILLGSLVLSSALAESSQSEPAKKVDEEKAELVRSRDIEMARRIREKIYQDGALSIEARKITIVTDKGKVKLSGPVGSEFDRQTVERIATIFAGDSQVTDNLTVGE